MTAADPKRNPGHLKFTAWQSALGCARVQAKSSMTVAIKNRFLDYFKLFMVYAGITKHLKVFKLWTERTLLSWESQWPKSVVGTDGGEQLILMYTPKQTGGRWKGWSARSLLRDTSVTWPDTLFCAKIKKIGKRACIEGIFLNDYSLFFLSRWSRKWKFNWSPVPAYA